MKWPTGSRFVTGHETVFPAFCFLMISDLFFVLEIQRLFHAAVNNSIHDRLFGWGVLQDQGFVPYYNKGAIKRSLVDSWAHYNNKLEKEVVAGLTDTRSVFFFFCTCISRNHDNFWEPAFRMIIPWKRRRRKGGGGIYQTRRTAHHSQSDERKKDYCFRTERYRYMSCAPCPAKPLRERIVCLHWKRTTVHLSFSFLVYWGEKAGLSRLPLGRATHGRQGRLRVPLPSVKKKKKRGERNGAKKVVGKYAPARSFTLNRKNRG